MASLRNAAQKLDTFLLWLERMLRGMVTQKGGKLGSHNATLIANSPRHFSLHYAVDGAMSTCYHELGGGFTRTESK